MNIHSASCIKQCSYKYHKMYSLPKLVYRTNVQEINTSMHCTIESYIYITPRLVNTLYLPSKLVFTKTRV